MFEKIAKLFKEETVRQCVHSNWWRTRKAVQVHGSLREGQRDMEKFKCSVGERRGEVQDKPGRNLSLKTIAIPHLWRTRKKTTV